MTTDVADDLADRRRLRSSVTDRVVVPAYRLATTGRQSCRVAGALLWKSLPVDIRSSPSLTVFRSHVKTYISSVYRSPTY